MTKTKLLNDVFKWGVLAAVVAFIPEFAVAQTLGEALDQVRTNEIGSLPPVISAVAYTGGAVLVGSGALKLKAHAENPAQEKLAPGIARLLAGGAVAALPTLLSTLTQTTHLTGTKAYEQLNPTF